MQSNKIFKLFSDNQHAELDDYFVKRSKGFWEKKIPTGKQYSYIVHDPFEVLGFDTGYEKLYLVGDNWLDCPEKPIAIAVGFNDWKFGFIADYLPEYRVAFGSRKMTGLNMIRIISKLSVKPCLVVIWGYTENKWLRYYLQGYKRIPIWRCEDGFIRSADLGANQATPYSLVFDKKGLYYNPLKSDITDLLNNYIFSQDDFERGRIILDFYKKNGLSKYNPAVSNQDKKVKIKKRILVIGQVENDASLRFGNVDNWSIESVIKLAKFENPFADIVYRPHPEVYQGLQSTKLNNSRIKYLCSIQSPNVSISDALSMAEHVYTITSLTGLEALLKGKKVTVLGKPFYGGWGLTDDRVKYTRDERKRNLSILELFIVTYLHYPRYLTSKDNFFGSISTIYRILADKFCDINVISNKTPIIKQEFISYIGRTYSWVALLEKASSENNDNAFIQILSYINFSEYNLSSSLLSQKIIAYFLLGKAKTDKTKNDVLIILRKYLEIHLYNKILLEIESFSNFSDFTKHWVWLLNDVHDDEYAIAMLDANIKKLDINDIVSLKEGESHNDVVNNPEINSVPSFNRKQDEIEEEIFFDKKKRVEMLSNSKRSKLIELLNKKFELQLENRKLSDAFDSAFKLLLLNCSARIILPKICILLKIAGKYEDLLFVSHIYQGLDLYNANREAINYEMLARFQLGFKDNEELIKFLTKLLKLRPESIVASQVLFDMFFKSEDEEEIKFYQDLLKNHLFFDNDFTPRKVQSFIAIENFHKAERVAEKLLDNKINSQVQYSQALSYNGKLEQAIELMESSVRASFVKMNVQELLRLNVLASRYDRSLELIKEAKSKGLILGDMHIRKAYFGKRMIGEALKAFTEIKIIDSVKKYYRNKIFDTFDYTLIFNSIILLSIFGPGDEIRFASIYNSLSNFFINKDIYITCSPRLKSLFERSFSDIHFVGVHRPRNAEKIDLLQYTNVPGSDIYQLVNNEAVDYINRVDKVGFVTDFLYFFLPDYASFPGSKFLVYDSDLAECFYKRLKEFSDDVFVGISWRSSLTTTSRNEHYLSVENLEPLFDIPNVQFVNLQYDECSDEIAWVNERYPGKLINFEDIDQYNDFESVSALMSCMDLVIAPATTVAELAGALGVKTWLFSNSSEIDWRKVDDTGMDVWHNTITILDVPEKGDKQKLVQEILLRLEKFVNEQAG